MRLTLLAGLMSLVWMAATAQEDLEVKASDGALLRGLDTVTGHLQDIEIAVGQTLSFKRLEITLKHCRYPLENPSSDAFAYLVIRDIREDAPRFDGWMVASSPALSALDHPRYDIWVLRCNIPAAEASTGD